MTIRFEGIEKTYMVYGRPQDRLWEWVTRRQRHRVHVALTGVDFEVQAGETFGLIGENGAGKSTLLKIAAGTIRPTHGQVSQEGRVAALLELGAGFHPEESGYDNIRFMAALHGLEGGAMEDFIIRATAFSELTGETLERPVKTYSSGMFMRLAFAAATAIDPDVLIVDEALSVGDLHFQKKSLNRILELRERGATVLFCSHNLYQVRSLCQRAAWIHGGRIQAIGATEGVVTAYEAHERRRYAHLRTDAVADAPPNAASPAPAVGITTAPLVKITHLITETSDGTNPAQVDSFQDLTVEIQVESYCDAKFHIGFSIVRPDKDNVFGTSTQFHNPPRPLCGAGTHRLRVRFPRLPLLSGEYLWNVYTLDDTGLQVLDMAELIQPFTVLNQKNREVGLVWLDHEWLPSE
ncbi:MULTISPECIES: ABC transporter ATP-binding protein [unclassified Acidovorax]|uniref:ABC transporter ATP-binding protein n=1 Tax=unclassified Acidovorax TaxID=2684926 RepID=UPI001C441125|nr:MULTISPECIES: ABC transporter ATP-binding protein [unclassified Acidovorax]MBV7428762.1 ABC transporter ATP-binding protein [Acidovorax sp. sif0732]MBV7450588.1 ABC transporter ATP-binding protein [Acidovorax sp. sif0715]